jgi:transposase
MAKKTSGTGRGVQGKPGRRYELTDQAWERIEPLLPKQTRGGRWNDHRVTLNGIFWILNSGAQWRDMPERYGKWQSVYHRYQRWTRDGLFDRLLHGCTSRSTRKDALTGARSTSTARTSAPTDRLREPEKKGKRRAGRPRPGTIPRRLWHEASSGDRRQRRAAGRAGDGGAESRIDELCTAHGDGEDRPSPTTRLGRGRQGLQLSTRAHVAGRARHQGGDSHTPRSARREAGAQAVSASQRGRAVHWLAQVLPPHRDTIREAGDTLPGDGQAGDDPTLPPSARSVKQNLALSDRPAE